MWEAAGDTISETNSCLHNGQEALRFVSHGSKNSGLSMLSSIPRLAVSTYRYNHGDTRVHRAIAVKHRLY
jgi:hypothetical protein